MGDNSRLPNLTNEQEKFFLETCIEETIRVGYMGISLQRESWAILGKKLFEAYGITSNQKQLKNKYDYMRGKYLAWSYLRRKTGNIYNPHTNMFNLTSQEWDDVCKVHPKAKYLKTAPLTNHELCATLFDKSSATGIIRRSVAPRKASSSSQNSSVRTLQIEDAPIESKDDENTYDEGTHETGYETGYETGFEGVLSLEEIDESEYGLELPKGFYKGGKKNEKVAKGKRKREEGKGDEAVVEEDKEGEIFEEVKKDDMKKKKKKNKKKKKKKDKEPKESVDNTDTVADEDDKREAEEEEEQPDDSEYHAWYELRLHPLLMKSISRLKFKEPTPIQKVCIPAGAHQGKDVSGAAETGSGKTLAFGLPILQRLLEEREKFERQLEEKGDADEKVVSKGLLRALIITPTRELALQVTDHLKQVAIGTDVRVVPIVGGMSTEKQERLLKGRPEVVVGTPGRLWELMSGGEVHLVELHSLSFFVLDEADRMIDNGHFHELQSIIDMLPMIREGHAGDTENCVTASGFQRKKRQTFVFSATIALSSDFRKKLKRGSVKAKLDGELNSIEALSERAGMRSNAAIIDLTNASIMPNKLEESFIECKEEDKDACLYYILSVHGHGRTIVFCTSIAALRHISSLMKILNVNVWTLHAQMQQRARLKAIDRFRGHDHGILVATDVAARGLDIPGVRTVVHYQLPHSAEVYVHRSGRTARASADGCSIALISPKEASKFTSLCKSFSKKSFKQFPIQASYMPEVLKRLSLARQIDRVLRKESQDKADKSWFQRNAESIDLIVEENDSEEERVNNIRKKKSSSAQLKNLQQELKSLVSRPLQPKSFSSRYLAGAGISPLLQQQFEELGRQKRGDSANQGDNKRRMVVIGQDCVEPLTALRSSGQEISMDTKAAVEKRRNLDNLRRKRKEDKKRLHDQKRKQRKKLKAGGD